MNVVTANENKQIIDRLDIDIIKRIDGEYELRELLSKFVNLYFNKMIIDITSIKDYKDLNVIQDLAKAVDPSRVIILLNSDEFVNSSLYMSNLVKCGFYNITRNYEGIKFLYNNPNSLENVKHLILDDAQTQQQTQQFVDVANFQAQNVSSSKLIVGIANLTNHGGASTLTNIMVKQLNNHGVRAYGAEMFRNDLIFYHSEDLFSCMNRQDLDREINKRKDAQAFIIDLNDFGDADRFCNIILYLVEPSYIRLTKLLKRDRTVFATHKNDNIVLNMSFVAANEVSDFQAETGTKVYFNIPPINDRNENIEEINMLLRKLGFKI